MQINENSEIVVIDENGQEVDLRKNPVNLVLNDKGFYVLPEGYTLIAKNWVKPTLKPIPKIVLSENLRKYPRG